jgi:PTS system mannose-specific IIC component
VSVPDAVLLVGWGTLVGLDLVSVPQMMIARPLVAGAGAGALLGDLPAGLMVGTLFELFQYDVLPVGAVRYPEYGPATVAAVSAAAFLPPAAGLGLGALVGLTIGLLAGVSLNVVRRLNTRAVQAAAPALEAGDARALVRLHVAGLGRDAARAVLVIAVGLGAAQGLRHVLAGALAPGDVALLAAAAIGAAVAAGAAGTLRVVGHGLARAWLAVGVLSGVAVAWLR